MQENAREAARPRAGAQFTCFTGTTVQILMLRTRAASWRARRRRASRARRGGESCSRGRGDECGGGGGGGGGHIALAGICAHSRTRLARIGRRRLWRRPLGRWGPICACRACRGGGYFRPVSSGTPTPRTPTPTHTASHAQPAAAERRCALSLLALLAQKYTLTGQGRSARVLPRRQGSVPQDEQ